MVSQLIARSAKAKADELHSKTVTILDVNNTSATTANALIQFDNITLRLWLSW